MNQSQRHRGCLKTALTAISLTSVILLILALTVGRGRSGTTMTDQTSISVKESEIGILFYGVDHDGMFPVGDQKVWELLLKKTDYEGKTLGPYLEEVPTDAWGNPIVYRYPPAHNTDKPDIWSTGLDLLDPEDDIGNWSEE